MRNHVLLMALMGLFVGVLFYRLMHVRERYTGALTDKQREKIKKFCMVNNSKTSLENQRSAMAKLRQDYPGVRTKEIMAVCKQGWANAIVEEEDRAAQGGVDASQCKAGKGLCQHEALKKTKPCAGANAGQCCEKNGKSCSETLSATLRTTGEDKYTKNKPYSSQNPGKSAHGCKYFRTSEYIDSAGNTQSECAVQFPKSTGLSGLYACTNNATCVKRIKEQGVPPTSATAATTPEAGAPVAAVESTGGVAANAASVPCPPYNKRDDNGDCVCEGDGMTKQDRSDGSCACDEEGKEGNGKWIWDGSKCVRAICNCPTGYMSNGNGNNVKCCKAEKKGRGVQQLTPNCEKTKPCQ